MNLPCDCRATSWVSKDRRRRGRFNPVGKLVVFGDEKRLNPVEWSEDEKVLSARIIMGFHVTARQVWDMPDLIANVKKFREKQGVSIDSTFVVQRGLYFSLETGEETEEAGAQVIFINLPVYQVSAAIFESQMVDLAEQIAEKMEQARIVLEIQRGGIVAKVGVVTPPPPGFAAPPR